MKAACVSATRAGSLPATTVAAGRPAAISAEKLGPESAQTCSGRTPPAAMTSLIRRPLPGSIPLAAETTVVAGRMNGCRRAMLSLNACAGTAMTTMSASTATSGRLRVRRPSGKRRPGRKRLFSPSARRRRASSTVRQRRKASWPLFASSTASVVPQAPVPATTARTMATLSDGGPPLAALADLGLGPGPEAPDVVVVQGDDQRGAAQGCRGVGPGMPVEGGERDEDKRSHHAAGD
jgi:hypothetical protein